jgi:hypothetical protein
MPPSRQTAMGCQALGELTRIAFPHRHGRQRHTFRHHGACTDHYQVFDGDEGALSYFSGITLAMAGVYGSTSRAV